MPTKIEHKVVDPEAELSNVQRTFQKLAPMCSVGKRAAGIPQLAPQEKQMDILTHEMEETLLCINLAKKGQHAIRDAGIRGRVRHAIFEYDTLEAELRDERSQQEEMDCLIYLIQKYITELVKEVPTESNELGMLESANNRLRRMENRLGLATTGFCIVNAENKRVREEIRRRLVERNDFNIQWRETIDRLVRGKEYLMDILEIATMTFGDRDEYCRKLETLKWKGLFQLNRDINEMKSYEGELNHLSKLEEFLRVKGSTRICEADEKEEYMIQDEIIRCQVEIAKHDDLLEEIFDYAGTCKISSIIKTFNKKEVKNDSLMILLSEIIQGNIFMKKDIYAFRQRIEDQHEINESREEQQKRTLAALRVQLEEQRKRKQHQLDLNEAADATFTKLLKGIDDLVRIAKCEFTPLLTLLGYHKGVTKWNVHKFLKILEIESKSLIQVVYGAVKPPPPTKSRKAAAPPKKLVRDPYVEFIRPNKIDMLVPYRPCPYCVEDYIMNQVFETPAVPADSDYLDGMFHMENVNTKFGIYTLTNPTKRHPYRGTMD